MATRESVLADLHKNNNAVLTELRDVPEAKLTEVFYGAWSAREILAHFAGWYDMMGAALERMGRGERPSPEGVDLNDTDGMNARYVQESRGKSVGAVRKDLETGLNRLETAAKALPEDRFVEGRTAMKILEGMANHPLEHLDAIRAWKEAGSPAQT